MLGAVTAPELTEEGEDLIPEEEHGAEVVGWAGEKLLWPSTEEPCYHPLPQAGPWHRGSWEISMLPSASICSAVGASGASSLVNPTGDQSRTPHMQSTEIKLLGTKQEGKGGARIWGGVGGEQLAQCIILHSHDYSLRWILLSPLLNSNTEAQRNSAICQVYTAH